MIEYNRHAYGLNLLNRLHGSAIYRAMIPGAFGLLLFFFMRIFWVASAPNQEIKHTYVINSVITGILLLLVFRVAKAYERYWEAASSVFGMMSKWMDGVVHIAAYHMQCDHYSTPTRAAPSISGGTSPDNDDDDAQLTAMKPPSYFHHGPHLNHLFLTRERERVHNEKKVSSSNLGLRNRINRRAAKKSIESPFHAASPTNNENNEQQQQQSSTRLEQGERAPHDSAASTAGNPQDAPMQSRSSFDSFSSARQPLPLEALPRLDGGWGKYYQLPGDSTGDAKATFFDPRNPNQRDPAGLASIQGGRTPPLFLQELCHLSSLLCAVAFATLRNNELDGNECPVISFYEPGEAWPPVDPDAVRPKVLTWKMKLSNFLGRNRSSKAFAEYHAARPLPVLGGVSDAELHHLQMARGSLAKTQLVWYWLSEFITREHLAGSTGAVGPPIISRTIQFLSDGMLQYSRARMIMLIPFPFVHAQLAAVFCLWTIPLLAFLMHQYCTTTWVGAVMTFFSVTLLNGLHEVARELEFPFRNIPNELPISTFQAQFNETLLVMFAGYHPDSYWEGSVYIENAMAKNKKEAVAAAAAAAAKVKNDKKNDNDERQEQNGDEAAMAVLQKQWDQLVAQMEQQSLELEQLRLRATSMRQTTVK